MGRRHLLLVLVVIVGPLLSLPAAHGQDDQLTLTIWNLPFKESRSVSEQAQWAVVEEFMRRHPNIRLEGFRGLNAPGLGMEVGPLLAMAGGVAPDVMYVNFRISDSYIQQEFLYPLDDYVAQWRKEENLDELIYDAVWPVIKREGPDDKEHIWAIPYGTVLMTLVYRKDLFKQAGLDPDRPPQTWDEFYEYAKKLTIPEKKQYGIGLYAGPQASWFFVNFLWSAGGEAVKEVSPGRWEAVYNDEAALTALKFYQKLGRGRWKRDGKEMVGVSYRDPEYGKKWERGEIGMTFAYVSDQLMSSVNPSLIGIAPVPLGPTGVRGNELNCTMMGINSTIKDPRVRDAAWEYIKLTAGSDAQRIRTFVYVKAGYAKYVNPMHLRRYLSREEYARYSREIPRGWEDTFKAALAAGRPEPYGRNCEMIYAEMTPPLDKAWITDDVDLKKELDAAVAHTNEKLMGLIPPEEMALRRRVAAAVVLALFAVFYFVFRTVIRAFSADIARESAGAQRRAGWRKYKYAYLIMIPALLSVVLWQYYPLARGTFMAFQDYKIIAHSAWVGLNNFAEVLFTPLFWKSLLNSLIFMVLSLSLGFLTPIVLALMLHEVPRGKILYRTLYYLPAVTTGLVIMFLWKGFFDPSDAGLFNKILTLMHIPAQKWLGDPKLAMFCIVLPTVWAGAGPGCIIYLAALKSIPEELYEAADLDGAGIFAKIRGITIPYLKPLIIINFVGAFVGAFRSFDFIFVMTGGGPVYATHVAGLEIWYNAFLYLKFGYAVSMAWLLGALIVGFTVMQLRILSRLQFRTAEA